LRIVFPKANKFKNITQVLTKLVDEAPLFLSETGLSSKSLSEDKTTMVILSIPAEAFEEIELEDNIAFKVNSRELHRIMRRGTRNDVLEMEVDRENRVLRVIFRDKKTDVVRSFELPIALEGIEEVGEPKVELPVRAEMMASDFKNLVGDAKLAGEEVEIKYSNKQIIVRAESPGRMYECVLKENQPLLSLSSDVDEASAKYGVDLLAAATRAATSSATVSLSFGTALPIRLHFELPDIGTLVYWIAPRV